MKKFNLHIGQKQMIFATASPIDLFYCEKVLCKGSKKELATIHCNPLHVLLNQKRLDKLGQMNLDLWISQFDLKKSTALDELRKQCSDEDLLTTIKSRHIQSPAELLSWSRYMSQNMDQFNDQVKSILAEQTKQVESTVVELTEK